MDKDELRQRTKKFALRALKLARALPKDTAGRIVAAQFIDSATSVGSNYRSCLRARSRAEWASKLSVALEEADESAYWLEIIMEDGMLRPARVEPLHREASELTAIFTASLKTFRSRGKS
jgi:four helix bundle protein